MASFTMVAQSAIENVAAVVSFSLDRLSGEVKMLKIRDNQIIDQSGKILKTFSCPFKIPRTDLRLLDDSSFECVKCSRAVYDTDRMREAEIIDLLRAYPNACLKLNRFNPSFSFE